MQTSKMLFNPAPGTPEKLTQAIQAQIRDVRTILAARATGGRYSPQQDAAVALKCVEHLAEAVERIALLASLHHAQLQALDPDTGSDAPIQFASYRRAIAMRGGDPIYETLVERVDLADHLAFCGWEIVGP